MSGEPRVSAQTNEIMEIVDRRPHRGVVSDPLSLASRAGVLFWCGAARTASASASASCCYPDWPAGARATAAAIGVMVDRCAHHRPPNDPLSSAAEMGASASCCYPEMEAGA